MPDPETAAPSGPVEHIENDGAEQGHQDAEAATPPVSEASTEFGRRVRERRTELGVSQEKLAHGTALHWTYISQVERGLKNPTLVSILRLAEALEAEPGDLVRGLKAPEKN